VSQTIQLLVVDDHAMFRDAIAEKLGKEPDMAVAGSCGSASEALEFIRAGTQPAVILLDFDLGSGRVIEFVHEVKNEGFSGQILVVTAGVSGREAVELIQAGVHGILHKHNTQETLCAVIRQVAGGEVFLEKTYLASVFHDLDRTRLSEEPHLTDRDKAVLRLLFQGLANKEIASHLQVSEGTIKSAISQLFQKLGVRTRAQLVKIALEQYSDQL
jgi:two-component system nitrate/nitrite response regulator NarL